jgi:hypothetical protein
MSLREKILSEITNIQDETLLKELYAYVQKLSADSPTNIQPKSELKNIVRHVVAVEDLQETKKILLFGAFQQAAQSNLFNNIANPTDYQTQLRNEWE